MISIDPAPKRNWFLLPGKLKSCELRSKGICTANYQLIDGDGCGISPLQ